jgi:O-antigen ligase
MLKPARPRIIVMRGHGAPVHPTSDRNFGIMRRQSCDGSRVLGRAIMTAWALLPVVTDARAWDDGFMIPKWAWLAAWSGAGLALLLAQGLAGHPLRMPLCGLWGALLAWLLWHWIAVAWAPSLGLAVDRALRVTWLTVALWATLHWARSRRDLTRMGWALIALGIVTAIWVLRDDCLRAWLPGVLAITPNLSDWRGFLAAGLGNTSHIGDLLALAILPALVAFGQARRRFWTWMLGGVAVLLPAGLIVSYSVGSNLGLILGALVMIVLVWRATHGRWFLRRWRRWATLVAAWAMLVVFFNVNIPLNPHRPGILKEGFGSKRWHDGAPTRLVIWAEAVEMIRRHPLLGVGTGNFTYVYPEMDSAWAKARPDLAPYQGIYTNAAHNELLQAWAELGVVGLALLLAIFALAYRSLLSEIDRAAAPDFFIRATLAGLLTAWIAQAQMNFALQQPTGALCLYAILAATLIESDLRSRRAGMPPLVNESGLLETTLEWESMRRPTAIGVALRLPDRWARRAGWTLAAAAAFWMAWQARPVIAQREYRRAMEALNTGDGPAALGHFKDALDLDPGAVDIRSRLSDVLINAAHQPAAGLEQLALTRRRLNSSELFLREARAWEQLGQPDKAKLAMDAYRRRVGAAPNLTKAAPGK